MNMGSFYCKTRIWSMIIILLLMILNIEAQEECYWARCQIKKVNNECSLVRREITSCATGVSTKFFRWSIAGGSQQCLNGTCCLSGETPSYAVCVRFGGTCRCNKLSAFSCLMSPKKKTCPGPTTNSPETTFGVEATTLNEVSFAPPSSASYLTSLVPSELASTAARYFTEGNLYSASTEKDTTISYDSSWIYGQTEYNLTETEAYTAITFEQTSGYEDYSSSGETVESTEEIAATSAESIRGILNSRHNTKVLLAVEENLRNIGAKQALKMNGTRYYKDENIEFVTRHPNCSERADSLSELSSFRINYTVAPPETFGACPGYFIMASQFVGSRLLRRNFTSAKAPESQWDARRQFLLLPEESNFLTVSAYSTHDLTKWKGQIVFKANLSVTKVVMNQFAGDVAELVPGEKIFLHNADFVCGYYDNEKSKFSTYGCGRVDKNSADSVTCSSNHTTAFAIMLSIQATVVPQGVQICSYVTQSLSVFFLCLTIVLLEYGQTASNSDRLVVQRNTAISLLLLHLTSLFHDVALENNTACFILAVLSHYFLCTTGTWMLVEGIRVLIVTSKHALLYRAKSTRHKLITSLLLGWGVPTLIVFTAVVVGILTGTYMDPCFLYKKQQAASELNPQAEIDWVRKYDKCWLAPGTNLFIVSVIVPIATVLGLNVIITAKVTVTVIKIKNRSKALRNEEEKNTIRNNVLSAVRALLVLIPVLGLPWIIGFFTGYGDYESSVIVMYVNATVNGLQGMFIFVLCCLVNQEVRAAIKCCKPPVGQSNATSKGGHKLATLSHTTSTKRLT